MPFRRKKTPSDIVPILRSVPREFDVNFYRSAYRDMRDLAVSEAELHYLAHGLREGRVGSDSDLKARLADVTDFDPVFYISYYQDLRGLDPLQAQAHYVTFGRKEERIGSAEELIGKVENEIKPLPDDFDPKLYLVLNGDLRRHFKEDWEATFHYLKYGRYEGRPYRRWKDVTTYDLELLTRKTLHVYDMPEVLISNERQPTVNVLVPAFDFGSMSAGFFGVFQIALYIKQCGLRVRLVLYEQFIFDLEETREKLANYPGMEHLLDEVEVDYIGERDRPLLISRHDNCVATVWYSAYMARKIMNTRGGGKFMYLIQDYESVFHPSGTQFALAENSYSFDYCALFSSKALQDFFLKKQIGIFGRVGTNYAYFNNACASVLKPKEEFIASRKGKKKRLAFYSRPPVDRNMFDLGALSLCMAVRAGIFPKDEWEFIGIGLGEAVIMLDDDVEMKQMQRMNLKEYQEVISTFDIGFCLMASSHPSLLPFDLSGSGAVVVTNSFGVKDQAYFDIVTEGVIVCDADMPALVEGLRKAVDAADDLETRYANAEAMTFPRSWDETFGHEHESFIRAVFKDTAQSLA
ncbi:hypothetical protein WCQ02_24650 [Paraburkholderia tropica]|uniref:rhamnosyltransferase WsaF family glycosyltransferase n=1 Tax=Paraburkholderia tropica TaxID=92647 RepID=UPI00301A5C19